MKVTTDHFLKIGNSHKMCEDYIISGIKPFPYVILSDGCSTSNKTDIGSRILVEVSNNILNTWKNHLYDIEYHSFGLNVITQSTSIIKSMGLPVSCLDTTLMVAFQEENWIIIFVYGDGYIFVDTNNGFESHEIEFEKNAPYYLTYLNNPDKKKIYHNFEIKRIYKYTTIGGDTVVNKESPNDELVFMFDINGINSILLSSDGIGSFNSLNEELTTQKIMRDMINFKSTKGKFIQRRERKLINRYEKNGIKHFDDISIGGFHFEDSNKG